MTDLVERLRNNQCPENHGCGTQPQCVCADMDDAADEITRLQSALSVSQAEALALREGLAAVVAADDKALAEYEAMGLGEPGPETKRIMEMCKRILSSTPTSSRLETMGKVVEAAIAYRDRGASDATLWLKLLDALDALTPQQGEREPGEGWKISDETRKAIEEIERNQREAGANARNILLD